MNNEQDYEIISALSVTDEPLTAYAIAKETGISVPQVAYRMTKLLDYAIVTSCTTDGKTKYEIHPVLKSIEKMEEIVNLLADVIILIDETQAITTHGVKKVLAFFVDRIEFEDNGGQ